MSTVCGRVYNNQVSISNGQKTLHGTAPWNAGVYGFKKSNSNYDLICGGSIISSNLVVSAAHCFWKNGMSSNRILVDDGKYKIAVGKYDRNINVIDNNFTQILNLEIVYLEEGYYGNIGLHAEDIAIIVLKTRISFSISVAPICIDWNGKYNEVNGDKGTIVGWGKMNNDTLGHILLEASLLYINRRSCRDFYTNGFKSYATFDKFCAGSALGVLGTRKSITTCLRKFLLVYDPLHPKVSEQGVSGQGGAGLAFFHSNFYYLTGVASVRDPVSNNSIVVFTEVKFHIQWIRELYNKHK